jgi:hypothetical protein
MGRLVLLLLGLCLGVPALAAEPDERWPALSYDTRGDTSAEVEALKARVDAGFWLETGDALLVVAPGAVHAALARHGKAAAGHGLLRASELFLLPMGCEVDAHQVPNPIAVIGRHALVRMPPALAARVPDAQAVKPDSVLAREVRTDVVRKRAADPAVAAIVAQVDAGRWFSRVQTLSSFDRSSLGATDGVNPGIGEIDAARDWLRAQFEGLGYTVATPAFVQGNFRPSNVIATRPGTTLAGEWVLVGGHYDSRNGNGEPSNTVANTPGAEDNASGCAGVLELATIFANVPTRRTLVFACYAGEEQGLFGSTNHMQTLSASGDLSRIRLAMIMDMIGFSADSDLDVLLETSSQPAQAGVLSTFSQLATDYAPGLRAMLDTNPCCSDHMPWINQNVPALLTIENDWNLYPHYHRTTDIPANMTNAQAMAGLILRMNTAALATYAQLAELPLFTSGFEVATPNTLR